MNIARRAAGTALTLFLAESLTAAVIFTNDTFINAGDTNYDGAEIVVSNCRLTIDGFHSFARLELQPGAELTDSGGLPGLRLVVSGDAVIAQAARVNLDGKGFPGGIGPGAGVMAGTPSTGSGASHGGFGGKSAGGASAPAPHGSYASPIVLGAGGGRGSGGVGGNGGGAIQLQVAGTLRIDGVISAGGTDAVNARSGGGAGGSIWVNAGVVTGSGIIRADGGRGEPSEGGGGSGGRIAIHADTNLFTGEFSAVGGSGFEWGGPGTIWQQPRNMLLQGKLLVANAGKPGRSILLGISSPIEVTLGSGVTIAPGNHFAVARLHMASNSWLTISNTANIFVEHEAILEYGSGIVADGTGSAGGQGSGAGAYSSYNFGSNGGGGGHGGYGGQGGVANARGGGVYGQWTAPTLPGSGGGGLLGSGGAGGGVIKLEVGQMLLCNGVVSANGANGVEGRGGGSGGSVWIKAGTLAGAGRIESNGGEGGQSLYTGGGGGGGRIAVEAGTNVFLGRICAYGGDGDQRGGAGTVYLTGTRAGSLRQLLADNGGRQGSNTVYSHTGTLDVTIRGAALLSPISASSLSFGNLEIGSNSWLQLARTGTTPYSATMTVNGNARIAASGGISANGAGYPAGSGPGLGRGDRRLSGGGGGHGGMGGSGFVSNSNTYPSTVAGGSTYGSLSVPRDPGSGGASMASYSTALGGSGGGSLGLTVKGTLILDGTITANGVEGTFAGDGGGSGGSILLTVGTLIGDGLVSADGGAGSGLGGGGGGGCIAIAATLSAFSGKWTAFGGPGYNAGGAGTVFVRSTASSREDFLLVDNAGRAGTNTPLFGVTPMNILVKGGASVRLGGYVGGQQVTLNGLRVGSGSSLKITNASVYITGDATIEEGGMLLSDGAGRPAGQGIGAGKYHQSVQAGDGGGYGGYGVGVGGTASGGIAFGQITSPQDLGSGGGNGGVPGSGGAGGGAVALNVAGGLIVDGLISANGSPASGSGGGGGSGGAVWLTCNSLSGAGAITANGGDGSGRGGGGGGGRIYLSAYANVFTGSISAIGGYGGGSWGGAGTICLNSRGRAASFVRVDNAGHAGFPTLLTPMPSRYDLMVLDGGVATAPSLTLSNLFIGPGGALTASQSSTNIDFRVEGSAIVAQGGRIAVDGRGYGPNIGPGKGALTNMIGSGAGHGGRGGASSVSAGGLAYGSVSVPAEPGSGGGAVGTGSGSEGGGAMHLRVEGTLAVDGEITADGHDGLVDAAGGGAGGSIMVSAGVLSGTGLIAARGGAGEPWLAGGGGGGRIAIYSPNQLFRGNVSAVGGAGFQNGEDGSVYYSPLRILPLIVTGHSPSGGQTQAVDAVEIMFNTALRPETLSLAKPVLTTPGGAETNLTVSLIASDRLRVSFPAQTLEGFYTLLLPPGVQNQFGESLSSTYYAQFSLFVPGVGLVGDVSGNNLLLHWSGVLGSAYQPLVSTNLVHWAVWGPPVVCTNQSGSLILEVPLDAAPKKFFKVAPVQ